MCIRFSGRSLMQSIPADEFDSAFPTIHLSSRPVVFFTLRCLLTFYIFMKATGCLDVRRALSCIAWIWHGLPSLMIS